MAQALAAQRIGPLLADGLVATCGMVELGVYGGLRDVTRLADVRRTRRSALAWLATEDRDLSRALEVQAVLLAQEVVVGCGPLLVAAVAERHGVIVLHHEATFDAIAKHTGQPVEWLP
jgi:predicted nucleic acid-binding protein